MTNFTRYTALFYYLARKVRHEKSQIPLLATFCYPFLFFLDNTLHFSSELNFADGRFRVISHELNFTAGKFCDISRGLYSAEKAKVPKIRENQFT